MHGLVFYVNLDVLMLSENVKKAGLQDCIHTSALNVHILC